MSGKKTQTIWYRFAHRIKNQTLWHTCLTATLAGVAVAMLAPGKTAFAQNRNAGELRGTVVDSTGAVVPGTEVEATETSTGLTVRSVTDNSGLYDMPYVETGHYKVTFSKSGYKTFVQTDVTLHIGTVTVNGTLGVGNVSEQVTVNSVPPLLETESPQINTVLSSQDATELPVFGASGGGGGWQYLLTLMPGVAPARGNNQTVSANRDSFNGSQLFQSSWLIDGGAATLPISYNPDRMIVPSEAIGEIDAITQGFGADTGNGLSVFNVITKSGTNHIHGSLWEYNQNTFFNAPPKIWTSVPVKPATHFNEFGGTVGGPVLKDRLFYFFGFQRLLQNSRTGPTLYTYPTDAECGGNFAGLNTIYDPSTTVGSGSSATRTAFPGNIIPSNRIDSVAKTICTLHLFPEPNILGAVVNNYQFVAPQPTRQNWYDWKVDGNLSSSNHLYTSGLATVQNVHNPSPDAPIDSSDAHYFELASQLTDVWTLSATKINEFRVSFAREGEKILPESLNRNYPTQIGLPQLPTNILPQLGTSGGNLSISAIGNSQSWTTLGEDNLTISDSFTWIQGKHTIKGGAEYDHWTDNLYSPSGSPAGNFTFNGIGTKQPSAPSGTGIGFADFLLGYTQSWNVTLPIEPGLRIHNEQFFVQDFYKPLPNLTVNAGIRLIEQNGWREEHDRIALYSPTLINPVTGNPGALGYAGNQIPQTLRSSHLFLAPRLGFAWTVHDTTSVRGGFGLYPAPWAGNSSLNIGPALTPVAGTGWTPQGSKTSPNNIADVFQLSSGPPTGAPGLIYPTAATRTPALLNGQNVPFIPYNAPMTYTEEYQLSVQHEFGNYLLETTYIGTSTKHLSFASDINQATPSATALPRPNTTYQAINATQYTGRANYNALQLTGHRQMNNGFSFLVHYTWAKGLDTGTGTGGNGGASDYVQDSYHPAANYAASGADIRNTANGSILYQLPFGKGRQFLNQNNVLDEVIGGWQLSTTYTYRSGLPITPVMSGANNSNSLAGNWFPNRIKSGKLAHPTVAEWFDTTAFVTPATGTFGNSRRNILYGPHFANVDMSIGKTFALSHAHDAWKLQVKMDMFDVFNHPNYGQPNANIGSGSVVGTITNNITNRQMQLNGILRF